MQSYQIGEKTFTQHKLAWRQIRLVLAQLSGRTIVTTDVMAIVSALGSRLTTVMGVILFPEQETREAHLQRIKDQEAFAAHVEFFDDHMELDTALEVMRDFFTLNRISYVSELCQEITAKFQDTQPAAGTTSSASAPSSPGATRPSEMASST
jgi:hypothetical protein